MYSMKYEPYGIRHGSDTRGLGFVGKKGGSYYRGETIRFVKRRHREEAPRPSKRYQSSSSSDVIPPVRARSPSPMHEQHFVNMRKSQDRYRIGNQPDHFRMGDTFGKDSAQLTTLVANFGNLDRMGATRDGKFATLTLVNKFITGPHHLMLLQEAESNELWREMNEFGVRYRYNTSGDLLIAAGGGGHKCVNMLDEGDIVNPHVVKPEKKASETARYLICSVVWTCVEDEKEGEILTRAGLEEVKVCSVHVNNVLAKKKDAVADVLGRFFQKVIFEHGCHICGGDFNGSVENKVLRKTLDELLVGSEVKYEMREIADDCIVWIGFERPETPKWKYSQSSWTDNLEPADFKFRETDLDWHKPNMVTIRSGTGRRRGNKGNLQTFLPVGRVK